MEITSATRAIYAVSSYKSKLGLRTELSSFTNHFIELLHERDAGVHLGHVLGEGLARLVVVEADGADDLGVDVLRLDVAPQVGLVAALRVARRARPLARDLLHLTRHHVLHL